MPGRMWTEEVTEDQDLPLDLAIEQVDEPRYGCCECGDDRWMKILRGNLQGPTRVTSEQATWPTARRGSVEIAWALKNLCHPPHPNPAWPQVDTRVWRQARWRSSDISKAVVIRCCISAALSVKIETEGVCGTYILNRMWYCIAQVFWPKIWPTLCTMRQAAIFISIQDGLVWGLQDKI